jgi:hypothetical protein
MIPIEKLDINDVDIEEIPVKINEILTQVNRNNIAIETLAWWLVDAQTGFAAPDARKIQDILKGLRDNAS